MCSFSRTKIFRFATTITFATVLLANNARTTATTAAPTISGRRTNKSFAAAVRQTNRHRRGGGASTSGTTTSRLTPSSSLNHRRPRVVTTAGDGGGRRRGTNRRNSNENTDGTRIAPTSSPSTARKTRGDARNDPDRAPSLEEMRSQLGPVGRLVACAVEVGVATAGSYISGGCFGYVVGGAMGSPNIFRKHLPAPPAPPPTNGVPPANPPPPIELVGSGSIGNRLRALNARAVGQAGSWGQLSAAFSGFHALTRVCRGGVEDKWNGLIGSAFTGAYLSRAGGPKAMVQGASTYAGFTYMVDVVFGGGKGSSTEEGGV